MLKNEQGNNTTFATVLPNYTNAVGFTTLTDSNAFALATDCNVEVIGESTTGCYPDLRRAFQSINDGIHTGGITVKIHESTNETASATLNASGIVPASYTSINIFPTSSGLSVSGNINFPLIDLSGADNVTLDGRVDTTGSVKDLNITNTSTEALASTIRFINDATNNIVKYCRIKGATTNITGGVVFFSTAGTDSGNDGNAIANNDISGDGANRPVNAVYSAGSETQENSGDTIRNNNIFNFFNPGIASGGVTVADYNSNWTISGNSFYDTTAVAPSADTSYHAIKVINYGAGYMISGNFIGGAGPSCSSTLVKTNTRNNSFYGIYLEVQSATVRANKIQNINWSNSGKANWTAIHLSSGVVTIGGAVPSDGNIIGDSSGTGSIILTGGAPKAAVIGINRNYSAGILGHVVIRNNVIGAIEAATNNDQNSTSIYCIRNNTFELIDDTISNNFIGSRTFANSIYASSLCLDGANAQNVYGVFNKGFGSTEISDNTISHLTNNAKFGISNLDGIYTDDGYIKACRNTISHLTNSCGNQNNSLVGINVSAAYGFTYLMGNHISNCRNTNPTESASTNGIFFASGFPGLIEKNFIHELYATSLNPASITRGIEITGFATTCQNNIISLQDATSGATVYGFYLTTGGHSIYYNTAHLSGNNGGNFDAAAALYGITPNFDVVIKNNIFANDKNGTGSHYAVYNHNFNTTHIEYNDYWGSTFNINPSPPQRIHQSRIFKSHRNKPH
jgi:hypothetical protein